MTKRLNNFEDHGVAQSRVRSIEVTCAHNPLGESPRHKLSSFLELQDAQISDLALTKKAVTDDVAGPLLLNIREQAQRGIHVRQIVLSLLDLRFVGSDPAVDLRPLILQYFDDQWLFHEPNKSPKPNRRPAPSLVHFLHNAELLNEALFFGLDHAREALATWVADYNAERPHSALGYMTPATFAASLRPAPTHLTPPFQGSASRPVAASTIEAVSTAKTLSQPG